MERKQIVKSLNDIIEQDRSASESYGKAIEKLKKEGDIEEANIINGFKEDFNRQVRDLSDLVIRYGGEPSTGHGVAGVFTKGMTSIATMGSIKTVFKALQEVEEKCNQTYEAETGKPYPEDVLPTLKRNWETVRSHLSTIRERVAMHK